MTRSEISARANRRALAFGSFARNGLIGVRAGVGVPLGRGLRCAGWRIGGRRNVGALRTHGRVHRVRATLPARARRAVLDRRWRGRTHMATRRHERP